MLEQKYDDSVTHLICECGVNPDDVRTKILNESTSVDANGTRVPIITIETVLQSFDVENWNRRIYGAMLVMDAINGDGMIQMDMAHNQWINWSPA